MKYIKARKDLLYILNPLLIILGIYLFCYFPHAITPCFYAFWIAAVVALFLIISPYGNQRFIQKNRDADQPLSWRPWFFYILLLELTLYGIYCGISFIDGQAFPINGPINTALFSQSLQTQLLQYGLFPWSLYGVIAIGMGVLAYREQTDAYFSNLMKPFTKQEPDGGWSLLFNIGCRRLTLFGLGTTLLFMIFLIMSFVTSPTIHLAYGFQTSALLTTLFLFAATFSKLVNRYVKRLFSRHISTIISFPLLCLVLALITLLLSAVTTEISKHTSMQAAPEFITTWIAYNRSSAWSIFSVMWWICLTPIVSGFIIRVSKGYKIRHILLGVLALPVAISVYFLFFSQTVLTVSPMLIKTLSLLSFLIVLPLLVNHANASNAIVSYFPKDGIIKQRDQQPFFVRLTQLTIIGLYFYLVIGINGVSLFLFAPNFLGIASMLMTVFAILKNL